MPAPSLHSRSASHPSAAACLPAVVGVAGGVGTSTVAAALGGRDLGVFTGRPAEVVVCRATVASVLPAGRVAALCPRPVVAVTAVDTGKLSAALRSRLALLEPHTAAIVVLPWVPSWHDLVDPLQELRDQLTAPPGSCRDRSPATSPSWPRSTPRCALSSSELRSPAVPDRPHPRPPSHRDGRSRDGRSGHEHGAGAAAEPGTGRPTGLGAFADQIIGWMKWGVLVAGVLGILVCAVMIILGRRNRSATAYEGLVGSAWILGGLALASVAAVIVGAFQV